MVPLALIKRVGWLVPTFFAQLFSTGYASYITKDRLFTLVSLKIGKCQRVLFKAASFLRLIYISLV